MKWWLVSGCAGVCACVVLLIGAAKPDSDALQRHRNLGKAFYENPTTQSEAVEEFRKALALAPKSVPERLNYGLALLRAGKTEQAAAELVAVQKLDPKLPHTWFNLGILYKKQGEQEPATKQFERMVQLVPDEPISHYNLGTLYKLAGKLDAAEKEFRRASELDATLAAPHFQLYNAYRLGGRTEDMRRELEIFQRLKKSQEGAAIPEDVEWCAYAEIYDVPVDRPTADQPATVSFKTEAATGSRIGAVLIDLRGDGKTHVVAWTNRELRLDEKPITAAVSGVRKVIAADYNNDGRADLCVIEEDKVVLLRNHEGVFDVPPTLVANGDYRQAVWLDYDHDYDSDLFLLGVQSRLLRNQGEAGFEDHTADFPFVSGEALDGAAFRAISDTKGFDLLVSYADREAVLYRDKLQGKYQAEPTAIAKGATRLLVADLNGDSFLDVLSYSGGAIQVNESDMGKLKAPAAATKGGPDFVLADLENRGVQDLVVEGGTARRTGSGVYTAGAQFACLPLAAGDLNGDGRTDVVCSANTLFNTTQTSHSYTPVRITGVRNLKLAPGAEVEVKAGGRYQKQLYRGLPLTFGLGEQKQTDTIRITWPNGLIQNEIRQAVNKPLAFQEAQRLSGSCPIIWSWNGRGFEYITDVLGVAPLGASSGDGSYFAVDHDEYIQIPGKSLAKVDGAYQIRITEELSEVAYLDQVKLLAVDHPESQAIYTNEKFKDPPFPEFRLFGVDRPIHARTARTGTGVDVLPALSARDQVYAEGFEREMNGVAKLHSLDLDFGLEAARGNRAVLVMNGWVDWADGSTFMAVSQEGKGGMMPPSLQVKDTAGRWQTVISDMGMPAGKPKSIVVDLTGKFLSSSREVRIVTNLCVYWDDIFLSESIGAPENVTTVVPVSVAGLQFRGFSPSVIHPERKQPERFSYENATPVSLWNPTPGRYTRYGDVRELVAAVDDKMIVMGSGDEVRLHFDARKLPDLKHGWSRDFLLLVDGWAKDRDANTAFSQSTEPLPFHGMSQFPYPPQEHYPDDAEHREYRKRYNTRPALRLIRPLTARNTLR